MSDKLDFSITLDYIKGLSDQDVRDLANSNPQRLREVAEMAAYRLNERKKLVRDKVKDYFGKVTASSVPNAYRNIGFSRKTVIAKRLTTNQVVEKFIDIRNVLNDKTSTWGGYRKVMEKMLKGMELKTRINMDDVLSNKHLATRFWALVKEATKSASLTEYKYTSGTAIYKKAAGNRAMQELVLQEMSLSGISKNDFKKKLRDSDNDVLHQAVLQAVIDRVTGAYEKEQIEEAKRARDEEDTTSLGGRF